MPTPADYQSVLDSLDNAMNASQGKAQVSAPITQIAEPAPDPKDDPQVGEYLKRAEEDVPRVSSLRKKMEIAARTQHVPVEYVEGISSRESRTGNALNEEGYDPEKKAWGVMQIDERYHQVDKADGPDGQAHFNQAAGILRDNKKQIDKKFPQWKEEDRWRAAIAAYNYGTGNVKTKGDVDRGTTGGDYSRDVLIRAKTFRERFHTNRKKR